MVCGVLRPRFGVDGRQRPFQAWPLDPNPDLAFEADVPATPTAMIAIKLG
jgi:hypothetical protein